MCFVLVIVGTMLLTGCEKIAPQQTPTKASDEIDFGIIKDSVYRNKYFGLTIPLPSEWSVQDQEAQKRIQELGSKIMVGDDKTLQAAVKATELQTVTLLMAFQHPLGTPVPYNPSIMCLAEQIRHTPGIKRGKDYLFHMRKVVESGQIQASFPGEVTTEKIGGVDFDVLHAEMAMAGIAFRQKHYAAVLKGYALVISLSYANEEEEASLQKIVESITLK